MNICEPIAEHFKIEIFRAKLLLLKSSLALLIDDSVECMKLASLIKDIEGILKSHYQEDASAYADYYYLQAKLLIKVAEHLFEMPDELNQTRFQSQENEQQEEQKSPFQVTEQRLPKSSDIKDDLRSLGTEIPKLPKEQIIKQSSNEESVQRDQMKKDLNQGSIEQEIFLNFRKAKQNYNSNEGIAKCLLSEAEFNLSAFGQQLLFNKFSANQSEDIKKDKSEVLKSDSTIDKQICQQYFDENAANLNIAKTLFATLKRKDLEARTLISLGQLWIIRHDCYIQEQQQQQRDGQLSRQQLKQANSYFEMAQKIYKNLDDQIGQIKVSDLLQIIKEKSFLQSQNNFIFSNSFPLVEEIKQKQEVSSLDQSEIQQKEYIEVGSLGTLPKNKNSLFKDLMNLAEKHKLSIHLKQIILNRSNIKQLLSYKIKILHLQSEILSPNGLYIEAENGVAEYINQKQIIQEFSSKDRQGAIKQLNADLLVLAMPYSIFFSEQFEKLSVKTVVSFNFDLFFMKESTNTHIMQMINQYIMKFCNSFYYYIFSRKLLFAFFEAEEDNKNFLTSIVKYILSFFPEILVKYNIYSLTFEQQLDYLIKQMSPTILGEADYNIFENLRSDIQLQQQECSDSSKILPPTNLYFYEYGYSFVGRKLIIQKIYESILKPNVKIIEINGEEGIGKTRLVHEAAEYLRNRHKFQKGIYYIDLERLKTKEDIQRAVYKYNNLQFNHRGDQILDSTKQQFCLIFDHIEYKNAKQGECKNDILSILKSISLSYTLAKFIFISNSKEQLFAQSNALSILIPPFNLIEASEFVNSNCNFLLPSKLLNLVSHDQFQVLKSLRDISDQLFVHPAFIGCNGFPKHLLTLCKGFEYWSTIQRVNIEQVIPNTAQRQAISQYREFCETKGFNMQSSGEILLILSQPEENKNLAKVNQKSRINKKKMNRIQACQERIKTSKCCLKKQSPLLQRRKQVQKCHLQKNQCFERRSQITPPRKRNKQKQQTTLEYFN